MLHLACSTSCLECSYSALGLSSRKGLQTLEKWLSRPRNVAWSHLDLSMSTGEGVSSGSAISPSPLTSAMLTSQISGRGFIGGFPYLRPFPLSPRFSEFSNRSKENSVKGKTLKLLSLRQQSRAYLVRRKLTEDPPHEARAILSLYTTST